MALRSGMGACASFAVNFRDPAVVTALGKHLDRYLKVRPLFAADFYPLTEWSDDSTKWLAFQFHDPAQGEGIVQAFCGVDTPHGSHRPRLHGLDPNKRYTITDWDDLAGAASRSGAELSNVGIAVRADGVNQAVVLHYTPDP